MRRVIVIIIGLIAFLIAGQTSLAVDKVEKKSGQTQTAKPPAPKPSPRPTKPASPKKPDPPKKKYDDFIDKNKNGIDDRQEKPGK
ncbi:MAG: hypothetical protein HY851_12470 [candidate division Zixibacteria bacterium]|nr:hypothetical protein [candidate division Zixibacteria bacterium]